MKSATAKRVAGSEPLKMSTPIKPFIQPFVVLFIAITPNLFLLIVCIFLT
ncbi:hypothetical protein [Bacillus cabrialesii]